MTNKEVESTEVWKPILGFEKSFSVSNKGRVKRLSRVLYVSDCLTKNAYSYNISEKILNGSITKFGYHRINITEQGRSRLCFIHRMVAEAFIENSGNKPQVNHIDGNKLNNHANNLEWCTQLENMSHAVKTGLKTVSKSTIEALHKGSVERWNILTFKQKNVRRVINTETNEVFVSVAHASRAFNLKKDSLRNFLKAQERGYSKIKYKNHKSYPFKYEIL